MKKYLRIIIQKIKNYCWHLPKAIYYQWRYQRPTRKLILIGITGTDGKTTTSTLIHQLLVRNGIQAGLITTIGARFSDKVVNTGLHTTSPDPSIIQPLFREMVDTGITHVIVEVTAHAMDQFRFFGCRFHLAGITNISHEHLDDFFNLNSYLLTKAKLFRISDKSILNSDDSSYSTLRSLVNSIKTYGTKPTANYHIHHPIIKNNLIRFYINKHQFITDSLYLYQIYNIALAWAINQELKLDPEIFKSTILHFPEIRGRREIVNNSHRLNCIVDFAHTPAALRETLSSLRRTNKGKLIVIFGATGGRDPSKRPLMGQVVSQIADIAIVTADDTRQERIEDINDQIISGFDKSNPKFSFYNLPNRQEAFHQAVNLAAPGDTIIACGKGHEQTILHGKTEYPWSEPEAFRTALKQKYGQI